MRGRRPPGRLMLLAGACYVVSAAMCCLLAGTAHAPFGDLRIYRLGGAAVLRGARLYDLRFAWNLGFTYPPFAALAFTVLAVLPWAMVPAAVTAVSVGALPATLWLALQLPGAPRLDRRRAATIALAAAAAAVWLEPVRTDLGYGQLNLVITALVLYDLSRDNSARLKGAAIGLTTGLKLTPVIFAVYLAATRRYRAAAVSVAVFGLTAAAGFAAAPADSAQFWTGTFANPARVGRVENAANQSLRGALARVLHTASVEPIWLILAAVIGLSGLLLAASAGRRGDEKAGFSLCAVTALLVSPVSWSHHWVLAVPALVLLTLRAWRRRSAPALAAAAAFATIGWSRMIWQVPIGQGRHAELHLGRVQLGFANAYVAAGLGAMAVAAAAAVRAHVAGSRRGCGRGKHQADPHPRASANGDNAAVARSAGTPGVTLLVGWLLGRRG